MNGFCPVKVALSRHQGGFESVGPVNPEIYLCPGTCTGPTEGTTRIRRYFGIVGPVVERATDVCGVTGEEVPRTFTQRVLSSVLEVPTASKNE